MEIPEFPPIKINEKKIQEYIKGTLENRYPELDPLIKREVKVQTKYKEFTTKIPVTVVSEPDIFMKAQ